MKFVFFFLICNILVSHASTEQEACNSLFMSYAEKFVKRHQRYPKTSEFYREHKSSTKAVVTKETAREASLANYEVIVKKFLKDSDFVTKINNSLKTQILDEIVETSQFPKRASLWKARKMSGIEEFDDFYPEYSELKRELLSEILKSNSRKVKGIRTLIFERAIRAKAEKVVSINQMVESFEKLGFIFDADELNKFIQSDEFSKIFSKTIKSHGLQDAVNSKAIAEVNKFLRKNKIFPNNEELASQMALSEKELSLYFPHLSDENKRIEFLQKSLKQDPDLYTNLKKKFVSEYANLAKEKGYLPQLDELSEYMGIDNDRFYEIYFEGQLFDDLNDIANTAIWKHVSRFERVSNSFWFTPEYEAELLSTMVEKDGILVSAAISGAEVDIDTLEGLITYAKENNLIFLAPTVERKTLYIDNYIYELAKKRELFLVNESMMINHNLHFFDGQVTAKQIKASTGLKRMGMKEGVMLLSSPKMEVETVGNQPTKIDNYQIWTTASFTVPNYFGAKFNKNIQMRTSTIAQKDHVLGAVVVKFDVSNLQKARAKSGNPNYFIRHMKKDTETGAVEDLNKLYYPDGNVEKIGVKAVIPGDAHWAQFDVRFLPEYIRVLKELNPEMIIEHDTFDAQSFVTWHHMRSLQARTNHIASGRGDAKLELLHWRNAQEFYLANTNAHIYYVKSNHDVWPERWKNEEWFRQDVINSNLGWTFEMAMNQGYSPIEFVALIGIDGVPPLSDTSRITFLKKGEGLELSNGKFGDERKAIELGNHGDGAVYMRGSPSLGKIQEATSGSISGHVHVKQMRKSTQMNDWIQVGSFIQKQKYGEGSFDPTGISMALVTENINAHVLQNGPFGFGLKEIEGQTKGQGPRIIPFPQGFPRIIDRRITHGDLGGGADQY